MGKGPETIEKVGFRELKVHCGRIEVMVRFERRSGHIIRSLIICIRKFEF